MREDNLILFLSESSNNLNLMAEGFANRLWGTKLKAISASMIPPALNSSAVSLMEKHEINITNLELLSLIDIELFMFDLVITLGHFDPDCRPNLPGMPPHIHWNVSDPDKDLPQNEILAELESACEQIKKKVETLYYSDLLKALVTTRQNFELILDNLLNGVMAHTANRRIFYFNKAAEDITGYKRNDIIGKDCHDVFPGRFCGGDCEYCSGSIKTQKGKISKKSVRFVRPDGKKLLLNMAVMPLTNFEVNEVGALLSFKDDTELKSLKSRLKYHHSLDALIGKDPKTLALFEQIREVGSVNVPVLLEGESGTGKELVVNAIHNISDRAKQPFIAINCAALPESILESELFGHVKGAFTGALSNRKGRFELADGGTLFLDEVGELHPGMQAKLLRVLQEQRFEPVGSEKSIKVDVRIISATNQNLRKLMEQNKFRRDLFYRLCVVPITLAPLREKKLDIPVLMDYFLEITAKELHRAVLSPSNKVIDFFTRYPWPGNIRELRNTIEYIYVKCRQSVIEVEHLPPEIIAYEPSKSSKPGPQLRQRGEVIQALAKAKGNKIKASKILKVSRATLYRYLDIYRIK